MRNYLLKKPTSILCLVRLCATILKKVLQVFREWVLSNTCLLRRKYQLLPSQEDIPTLFMLFASISTRSWGIDFSYLIGNEVLKFPKVPGRISLWAFGDTFLLSFLLQILFLEAQSSPSKFLPCKEGRKEIFKERKKQKVRSWRVVCSVVSLTSAS